MFKSDTLGKMLETNYQTQNDNGIKKKKKSKLIIQLFKNEEANEPFNDVLNWQLPFRQIKQ